MFLIGRLYLTELYIHVTNNKSVDFFMSEFHFSKCYILVFYVMIFVEDQHSNLAYVYFLKIFQFLTNIPYALSHLLGTVYLDLILTFFILYSCIDRHLVLDTGLHKFIIIIFVTQ